MKSKVFDLCVALFVKAKYAAEEHSSLLLLLAGAIVLLHASAEPALSYDGSKYKDICGKTLTLMEGPFGSLCTACAGIGAICAAAMGGFRMAWTLVVVSIGSFILGSYSKIFFDGQCPTAGGGSVMVRYFCAAQAFAWRFWRRHGDLAFFLFGAALLQLGLSDLSHAVTGDGIFAEHACNLLTDVLTKEFGAMVTVVAGALAIIASIVGAFKGAWVLLFVSVGCFIAKDLVELFFPMGCDGGGN